MNSIEGEYICLRCPKGDHITPGKKYFIYLNKFDYLEFIDDRDKRVCLNKEEDMNWNEFSQTFRSISHWRELQLEKIGI